MRLGGLQLLLVIVTLLPLTISALKCDFFENPGDENTEIVCGKESESCYALWSTTNSTDYDTNGTAVAINGFNFIKQGCWQSSPTTLCHHSNCTTVIGPLTTSNTQFFCCCNSDGCNTTPEYVYKDSVEDDETEIYEEPEVHPRPVLAILIVLTTAALVILIFGSILYWKIRTRRDQDKNGNCRDMLESSKKLLEVDTSCLNMISECTVLGNEIAHGKYGRVHNGKSSGRNVALKLYNPENRQFFNNEKWIYSQLGSHPNILKYYGWQEMGSHLVLVLERVQPGNLRDVLQAENPGIPQCLKLLRGISAGLAYLHGENPSHLIVAHRDLNSRNVLVNTDFRPVIADFGLSVTTSGNRYSFNGEEKVAEFSSLAEAGTTRYLAPELLEGAVNLKDCENALKQADIYSLALLLWEIANTSNGITLEDSQDYVLPYEIELGKDISHDTLVRYVVTRRDRPAFSRWRSTTLTRTLRDTLIESWDSEPDARLTALCISQRLADLRPDTDPCSGTAMTPLEPPLSNWTGRNPLLERNLYSVNDEGSAEYLIMSEKHCPAATERSADGSTVESQNTTHTDLSNNTIPYFNNLR